MLLIQNRPEWINKQNVTIQPCFTYVQGEAGTSLEGMNGTPVIFVVEEEEEEVSPGLVLSI